jgi:hypothetical protein
MYHLATLMEAHPNSRMKSLQQTALKEYPVHSRELYRHCMGARFAMKAADIINQLESNYYENAYR